MKEDDKILIHVLHCGQVQVDIGTPFKQKTLNPLAFAGIMRSQKYQVVLPVSAYLIEHPQGLVLVDTGWHTNVREGVEPFIKRNGRIVYKASKPILPAGQAINEQLNSLGVKTEDIDYVVITHLDLDHVSGVELVKNAKHILVSSEEWKSANKPILRYNPKLWQNVDCEPFEFKESGIGPEGRSLDIFGDGTIQLVYTPGHSKGLTSVLVQHDDKSVLICSDVAYAAKAWREMILPGMTPEKSKAKKSLQWVHQIGTSPTCVEVLPNHDLDIQPHVIEL